VANQTHGGGNVIPFFAWCRTVAEGQFFFINVSKNKSGSRWQEKSGRRTSFDPLRKKKRGLTPNKLVEATEHQGHPIKVRAKKRERHPENAWEVSGERDVLTWERVQVLGVKQQLLVCLVFEI